MLVATMAMAMPPQLLAPDSLVARSEAYGVLATLQYRSGRNPPLPRHCEGASFHTCRQGDWLCTGGPAAGCFRPDLHVLLEEALEGLNELAGRAGGSAWFFRQRVAFASRVGDHAQALEIAQECHGTEWWCLALQGFARHQLSPGDGVREFRAALREMPSDTACAWSDISVLLSEDLVEALPPLPCAPVAPAELERVWWLADPLWSRPGNEREAEHYSRHVMREAFFDHVERLDSIYHWRERGDAWHRDRRRSVEFLVGSGADTVKIPQGPWNSWRTVRRELTNPRGIVQTRELQERYVHGGFSFVPDHRRYMSPESTAAEEWAPEWDAGHERLVPREEWHHLAHQTAVLRRGDELLYLAAARLPSRFALAMELEPALALGDPERLEVSLVPGRVEGDGSALRAHARIEEAPRLASLEVFGEGLVGRVRHGIRPPERQEDGFGVSDLVLVTPEFAGELVGGLPPPVEVLEENMLPSREVDGREEIGLYFEVYGMDEEDGFDVVIRSPTPGLSLLQRMGRFLTRRGPAGPVEVAWEEPPGTDAGPRARALTLAVDGLPQGRREIEVTVRRTDGSEAHATVEVRIDG